MKLELRTPTHAQWLDAVLADFGRFLEDHAACEAKASAMAIHIAKHYPDKIDIVDAMADLAVEELVHFREVVQLLHAQGLTLARDEPDPYVNALMGHMRRGREPYMLDRLLIAAIVEARGHERFSMLAAKLDEGSRKRFYERLSRAEARHYQLFLDLACAHFEPCDVDRRLEELLCQEAKIVDALPYRAAVH
ncbi:MAG: tRNA-(ms[2]io[6]A)-hydroxylase [Pseudomonadales bacterium]